MDWSDSGIVLSARRYGETSAVVHVLTRTHGRTAGLVRGGAGRRARSVVQAGNEVQANWRARLPENLGTFTLELSRPRAARVLDDPRRLAALSAAVEILDHALPEREPQHLAYLAVGEMLDAVEMDASDWPEQYSRWELKLLGELGFGLDLAVAIAGDGPWAVQLGSGEVVRPVADGSTLALPEILLGAAPEVDLRARARALEEALALTGTFLSRAVVDGRALIARTRLVARLAP